MGLKAGGHYQLGTGTFGYEPKVSYFFGLPKAIEPGGVVFDIPLFTIAGVNDGDPVKTKQFVLQAGILSSALEHAVPEQLFVNEQNPGEAISAVRALQKASAAGQRISELPRPPPMNGSFLYYSCHLAEILECFQLAELRPSVRFNPNKCFETVRSSSEFYKLCDCP